MSTTISDFRNVWTLGDRLTKARGLAGLNQQQMADRLGIGRRSIARYESDQHEPAEAIILAYHAVTGVPLWFLHGDQPPPDDGHTQATPVCRWNRESSLFAA